MNNDHVAEPFRSILAAISGPILTKRQIANEQRRLLESKISEAAKEIRILADELIEHPADITMEACDGIHTLLGKIEAAMRRKA